ncbi:hypothetical protein VTK73DRAFT_1544 [Phialemonium thermophilum]|uniref:Uncharacterized protein n=1 Tax=Phialemonium thermophilum TaxID=223376 RepID=A0ABR3VTF9_9PEZI
MGAHTLDEWALNGDRTLGEESSGTGYQWVPRLEPKVGRRQLRLGPSRSPGLRLAAPLRPTGQGGGQVAAHQKVAGGYGRWHWAGNPFSERSSDPVLPLDGRSSGSPLAVAAIASRGRVCTGFPGPVPPSPPLPLPSSFPLGSVVQAMTRARCLCTAQPQEGPSFVQRNGAFPT